MAHRVAWELSRGQEPGPGLVIRHTCDVKVCCNPRHLLEGTQRDNVRDHMARGRPPHGRFITDDEVRQIRTSTDSLTSIARRFGTSVSYVCRIRRGIRRSPPPQESTTMPLFWSYDGCQHDMHDTPEDARKACLDGLGNFRHDAHEGGWDQAVEQIAWGPIAEQVVDSVRVERVPISMEVDFYVDYELRPVVVPPTSRDLLLSAYRRYVRGIIAMGRGLGDADRLRVELERTADEIERLEHELGIDELGEGGIVTAAAPAWRAREEGGLGALGLFDEDEPEREGGVVAPPAAAGGGSAAANPPITADPPQSSGRLWLTFPRQCPECVSPVAVFTAQLPPAVGDHWLCVWSGHHGTIDTLPPGARVVEVFLDGPPTGHPHAILTREQVEELAAAGDRDPHLLGAIAPHTIALTPELHSSSEDGHDLVDAYRRPRLEVIRGR